MKKDASSKIKLGVFVFVGIAVFIVGIYFIGEKQQLFRRTFHISGVFQDIAGLQAGDNVRLSGINVGTVRTIALVSDTSVRVDMLIDEDTRKFINKDAVASIGSDGLMGNKILMIIPGTGGKMEIEDNDSISTVQPTNLDDILISLKATIANTTNITHDLSKITDNIQSGRGTIGKLLMDPTLAQSVDSSVFNLEQGSAGFRTLTDKAKKSWLLWGF